MRRYFVDVASPFQEPADPIRNLLSPMAEVAIRPHVLDSFLRCPLIADPANCFRPSNGPQPKRSVELSALSGRS